MTRLVERALRVLLAATSLVGLVWVMSGQRLGAQQTEEDWPTIIAQLRYQLSQHPSQTMTRQQLATAYNNYGVSLGEQRQWALAVEQLEEALRLDDTNAQFHTNLSTIYLNQAQEAHERHRATEAIEVLKKALALNPHLAQAYTLLGQIEYDRQKLKEAKAAWQRALELDPDQPNLSDRLAQVTEELPVESNFERLSQAYFDIRYEEELERPVGFDIRDALLEARRLVGSDFSYWPKPPRKIVVLLYSAESFRRIRQETPDWVAGQFDGKIRVPMPSATMGQARVKEILFHEYTHAVIYDLTKGTCPLWLNEGLAEYQGRSHNPGTLKRLQAVHEADQVIPWEALSDHFSTALGAEQVALAYEQSYSLAAYLIQRYGFWRIRRLLKAIAEGQPWDVALEQEVHQKPAKLKAEWRRWLPEFLKSPR